MNHYCTVEDMDDGSLYCEECGAVYAPEPDVSEEAEHG